MYLYLEKLRVWQTVKPDAQPLKVRQAFIISIFQNQMQLRKALFPTLVLTCEGC